MRYDEDFLSCSLCLDVFTDPRALPCLHTFCHKCLKDLLSKSYNTSSNNGTFRCPLCQEVHAVPSNGASGFRQDFRIKTLTDKSQMNSPTVSSKEIVDMCKKHPNDPLNYFCTDSRCCLIYGCQKSCGLAIICRKCWMNDHKQHTVIPIHGCGAQEQGSTSLNYEIDMFNYILAGRTEEISSAKESISSCLDQASHCVRTRIERTKEIL